MHCMLMDLLHGFEVLSTTEETLCNWSIFLFLSFAPLIVTLGIIQGRAQKIEQPIFQRGGGGATLAAPTPVIISYQSPIGYIIICI